MTKAGAQELYKWLTTAWPLVIKPGAKEEWKQAKVRELYKTYSAYEDAEVFRAFQKWTEANEKFPTTKNIITELEFARALRYTADPNQLYPMMVIHDDGGEAMVFYNGKAIFTWNEFLNIPRNINHLDPIEWERRFKKRREKILSQL